MTKTLVSLIALLAATPAFAQSNPTQPTTDDNGDEVLVTASRSGDAVAVKNLGASVTIIDNEAMQERQTRIVSDVLRDVPGLAVNRVGAIGGQTQVRIRGSEANHVLVLIDGIKASDPYTGEFDFGTLIADEAAKIEVLRGQQSSLYGSDAIGGVIQYITLTGAEAPGVTLRAEGGSFGTASGGARIAGVAGNLDYALSSSLYRTEGTPTAEGGTRDVGSTSVGASGKVTWSPSSAFKLTGVGRYSYTDALTNNSQNDPKSPLYGQIVDSPGVRFTNDAFYGLLRAELTLADGRWTNALTGQIADTTRKGYTKAGFDNGDKGRRYKGSFESAFRFGPESFRSRITGAVDVEREEFQTLAPASPFTFTGQRHTDNIGLVGEYDLLVHDRLSLGASIRRDLNTRFDDATTWRAQGSYRFATGTRIRGAYGTGVKNPGYFELYGYSDGQYIGNPNLRPEKSKGWEAGLEQDFAHNKATIGATYFDSRLQDEIYTTFSPTFVTTSANRNTLSRQHGVEAFVSATPIPQLRFDLAYTYLHATENGVTEVRRPANIASLNTTVFSTDKRFSTTLTVRYNGRQDDVTFTDPTFATSPVVSLQEYVLVNLNASYALTPRVSVFGRVENLTDERYEEVFSFATPGRAAYGGVKVRL